MKLILPVMSMASVRARPAASSKVNAGLLLREAVMPPPQARFPPGVLMVVRSTVSAPGGLALVCALVHVQVLPATTMTPSSCWSAVGPRAVADVAAPTITAAASTAAPGHVEIFMLSLLFATSSWGVKRGLGGPRRRAPGPTEAVSAPARGESFRDTP